MNSKCIIQATPGVSGVQQSLRENLTKCMEQLMLANSSFLERMHAHVKITGDETNICMP